MRRRFGPRRRGRKADAVKRDVEKCGITGHIKVLGLPEKRMMYLRTQGIVKMGREFEGTSRILLDLADCENLGKIIREELFQSGQEHTEVLVPRYSQIMVSDIYVVLTAPYTTIGVGDTANIPMTVNAFYALENPIDDETPKEWTEPQRIEFVNDYVQQIAEEKQMYTFMSNKNVTFVLRRPRSMHKGSALVHRGRQWFATTEILRVQEQPEPTPQPRNGQYSRWGTQMDENESEDVPNRGALKGANYPVTFGALNFRLRGINAGQAAQVTRSFVYEIFYKVYLRN